MNIRQLSVPDAYEITPRQFADERGSFFEWYRFDRLEEVVGHSLDLRQGNTSVSRRGVVRGIHFADVPVGQAKYVTAPSGTVIDFIIDIRVGSPSFGRWDSVVLNAENRKAVYLAEGIGHAFIALTENATVSYLVSDVYNPVAEHGIDPLDSEVGLEFPFSRDELILSEKDTSAPGLLEARDRGLLPDYASVAEFYSSLNSRADRLPASRGGN